MKTSIEDWTSFIKSFTLPNYDKGELWKISTTPLIVVHLNFKKAESKDDKKKKTKTGKKAEDEQSADEDSNKINYFPKLEKCEEFFKNALTMIIESTN